MTSATPSDKLASLRAILGQRGLDGWYVGREDMFQGEEVPAREERLAFISGFTGSAGFGMILPECAALFSDGRYTLQAVDGKGADVRRTYDHVILAAPCPCGGRYPPCPRAAGRRHLRHGRGFVFAPSSPRSHH